MWRRGGGNKIAQHVPVAAAADADALVLPQQRGVAVAAAALFCARFLLHAWLGGAGAPFRAASSFRPQALASTLLVRGQGWGGRPPPAEVDGTAASFSRSWARPPKPAPQPLPPAAQNLPGAAASALSPFSRSASASCAAALRRTGSPSARFWESKSKARARPR